VIGCLPHSTNSCEDFRHTESHPPLTLQVSIQKPIDKSSIDSQSIPKRSDPASHQLTQIERKMLSLYPLLSQP
jgi:hypothetical protein